jgi:hypothetical protein
MNSLRSCPEARAQDAVRHAKSPLLFLLTPLRAREVPIFRQKASNPGIASEDRVLLKIDFLKRLGFLALSAPVTAVVAGARADASDDPDLLVGLWEASVEGSATYKYIYSISRDAYIATGNIDENFMNMKFGPTLGAYSRMTDGSYKYRERGFVYDMKGHNIGTFTSVGSFRLGSQGNTFAGSGTYTQYDLRAKPKATERYTLKGNRVPV